MIDELRDDAHDVAGQLGQGNGDWIRGVRWFGDKVKRRLQDCANRARRGP